MRAFTAPISRPACCGSRTARCGSARRTRRLCAFANEPSDPLNYNDNGEAIYACWRTPDLSGRTFYRNKTFSRFYVALASALATGVRAWGRVAGIWEELFSDFVTARYFSYAHLIYSKFTYSNDDTPRTLGDKIRLKKVDKAGFKVENGVLNEPFGLDSIGIEFGGNRVLPGLRKGGAYGVSKNYRRGYAGQRERGAAGHARRFHRRDAAHYGRAAAGGACARAFNELAGQLEAETAAADIGAAAPEGVTAAPAGKLQAVLNGLRDLCKAHTDRADNPRGDGAQAGGLFQG